jgi:hypothetical protein
MGLPNNVQAAMAIGGRTCEFVRRLRGKYGCCRGSSTGLWLTCLTFDPKCNGTFWAPNNVWAAMAIEGCACWGAGQWCKRFDVTMVMSSSSLDDVLLMGMGSESSS